MPSIHVHAYMQSCIIYFNRGLACVSFLTFPLPFLLIAFYYYFTIIILYYYFFFFYFNISRKFMDLVKLSALLAKYFFPTYENEPEYRVDQSVWSLTVTVDFNGPIN